MFQAADGLATLRVLTMQHLAIAAIATALALGAGAGAVTKLGPPADAGAVSEVANPMVAGQAMLASDTIFDNASRSPDHIKLVAALKAAGVGNMLQGKGPFTIFAPTDSAFDAMTPAARSAMFNPSHRGELARSMRYLIVAGQLDSRELLKRIGESGGVARLKTIEGGTITAMLNGPTNIALIDENGNVADIAIYDIYQSNGVIQVIDHVLKPAAEPARPAVVGMLAAEPSSGS
jgi:uncharacterized surface protein with fasciclin (FAS1) repeats